jgi:hypothetical protein
MARIHVERVFDKLEHELKSGLKSALAVTAPDNEIDVQQLFKEFKKQVIKNCKMWEYIESNAVDTD